MYDEMTDITRYLSPIMRVGSNKWGGKLTKQLVQVHTAIRIIIGIDNGEIFSYLNFSRRGYDWSWISDAKTIFLVDGVRTLGEAQVLDSFTTAFNDKVLCNEEVSQDTDIEYLWKMSGAKNVKFRVGTIDVIPPDEFIPNLKEILEISKDLGK